MNKRDSQQGWEESLDKTTLHRFTILWKIGWNNAIIGRKPYVELVLEGPYFYIFAYIQNALRGWKTNTAQCIHISTVEHGVGSIRAQDGFSSAGIEEAVADVAEH